MLAALAANWPEAQLHADAAQACALTKRIFPETPTPGRLHLVLRGTNFQIKVWEALIRIEPGRLVSYSQLARGLGMPRASRTVGSAIAANTSNTVRRKPSESVHVSTASRRLCSSVTTS